MQKINLSPKKRAYLESLLQKHRKPIDFPKLKQDLQKCILQCESDCAQVELQRSLNKIKEEDAQKQKESIIAVSQKRQQRIKRQLGRNYASFESSGDAYLFTKAFGVLCCPYCNTRLIPTTYDNGKVERPDIDHFEPQSSAPEKQLELENLVPCCSKCNRDIKNDIVFTNSDHMNPYLDDFDSAVEFDLDAISSNYTKKENFEIMIKRNARCPNLDAFQRAMANVRDFKLISRYKSYKMDVVKIFENKRYYDENKKKELNRLSGNKKSLRDELFSDEKCDINKTERGKLKKDIIKHYID